MKTILKKTLTIEVKRHDYDNNFAYIEVWQNSILKDCYFAEKQFLFPDGSLKNAGKKYFFCKSKECIEKKIKPLNYESFNFFENLYYFDEEGDIKNILE